MIQKKICLLGSFSVGKTSLVQRYVNSLFSEKYLTTVGVKIDKKQMTVAGKALTLMIWDIAGEDDFASLRATYLRGLAGYIVVIDPTRPNSYNVALSVRDKVIEQAGELPMVFALNKSDLKDQWLFEQRQAAYLDQTGYPVLETSAKSGIGVDDMFSNLAEQLMVKHG